MLATLGAEDANIEHVEVRESIKPLLEGLGEREKRILLLRFFKNMTQSQIAVEIGVSQMHVSRLLNRTLQVEWAYREAFLSNADRAAALAPWLEGYNNRRRHTALGGLPPISRL